MHQQACRWFLLWVNNTTVNSCASLFELMILQVIDADEVLLFEKATFLVISHCQRKEHRDVHRCSPLATFLVSHILL